MPITNYHIIGNVDTGTEDEAGQAYSVCSQIVQSVQGWRRVYGITLKSIAVQQGVFNLQLSDPLPQDEIDALPGFVRG